MITLIYGVCVFILSVIIYLIYKRVTVIEKFHEDTSDQYHNHVTQDTGYIPCIPESGNCGTGDVCCNGTICMDRTCQTSDDICADPGNYSPWSPETCPEWSCGSGLQNSPHSQTRTLNTGINVNCDSYLTRRCTNSCTPLQVVDFEYDLYFEVNGDVKIVVKSITTDIGLTSLVNSRLFMKLVHDDAISHSVDYIELTGTINGNTITLSPNIEMLYDFDTNFTNFLEGSYKLNLSFDSNPDNGYEKNLELNHITSITFTEPDYKQNLFIGATQNVHTNRFIKIKGFETRDALLSNSNIKVQVFEEEGGGAEGVSLAKSIDNTFVTDQPIRIKSPQATNMVDTDVTTISTFLYGNMYLMTDIVEQDTTNPNGYTAKGGDTTLYIQLPERKQYRIEFHLLYNGFLGVRRVYTLHIDARGCNDNGQGCGFSGCCVNANDICTTDWSSSTFNSPTCKTATEICDNDHNFNWLHCSWSCHQSRPNQTGTLKSGINGVSCLSKTRSCPNGCTHTCRTGARDGGYGAAGSLNDCGGPDDDDKRAMGCCPGSTCQRVVVGTRGCGPKNSQTCDRYGHRCKIS